MAGAEAAAAAAAAAEASPRFHGLPLQGGVGCLGLELDALCGALLVHEFFRGLVL